MTTPIIRTVTTSDEAPVIAVVVLAFGADPAARWTWPDPQQYLMHFPSFVKALGGNAFAHGGAFYVDDYAGAALWLPPGVGPGEGALITLHACGTRVTRTLKASGSAWPPPVASAGRNADWLACRQPAPAPKPHWPSS